MFFLENKVLLNGVLYRGLKSYFVLRNNIILFQKEQDNPITIR